MSAGDSTARASLPSYEFVEEGGSFVARFDGQVIAEDDRPARPFHELLWRIGFEATNSLGDELAFHAGAVSLSGRGVMLPASSGSGKSTLVAGLVIAGAGYLSDEVAILDGQTLVPFPRPLGLKRGSFGLVDGLLERMPAETTDPDLEQMSVAPDDLRPGAVAEACPLDVVVFPRYEAGSETVVEPVSRASGVVELIGNSFTFARLGPGTLDALADAARRVRFYRLRSGDLAEAVAAVRSLVEAAPAD